MSPGSEGSQHEAHSFQVCVTWHSCSNSRNFRWADPLKDSAPSLPFPEQNPSISARKRTASDDSLHNFPSPSEPDFGVCHGSFQGAPVPAELLPSSCFPPHSEHIPWCLFMAGGSIEECVLCPTCTPCKHLYLQSIALQLPNALRDAQGGVLECPVQA